MRQINSDELILFRSSEIKCESSQDVLRRFIIWGGLFMPVRNIPKNYLTVTCSFASRKNSHRSDFEFLLERRGMANGIQCTSSDIIEPSGRCNACWIFNSKGVLDMLEIVAIR